MQEEDFELERIKRIRRYRMELILGLIMCLLVTIFLFVIIFNFRTKTDSIKKLLFLMLKQMF